jgi:hypothetical protein
MHSWEVNSRARALLALALRLDVNPPSGVRARVWKVIARTLAHRRWRWLRRR